MCPFNAALLVARAVVALEIVHFALTRIPQSWTASSARVSASPYLQLLSRAPAT